MNRTIPRDETIRQPERPSKVSTSVSVLLTALKTCRNSKNINQGRRIHTYAAETGLISNILVAAALLDMYSKSGSLPDARAVFDSIPFPDTVSCTSLMLAYAHNHQEEAALNIFTALLQQQQRGEQSEQNLKPDAHAFVAAIKSCSSLSTKEESRQLQKRSFKVASLERGMFLHAAAATARGLDTQLYVGTCLVEMYSKCGSMEDAQRIFDRMPERNVVTWTSLVQGYAVNGEGEAALSIFSQINQPNSQTYVAVLKACSALSAKEQVKRVRDRLCKPASLERAYLFHSLAAGAGLVEDPFVSNTLIDLYSKSGSLDDCVRVFCRMTNRTVVSWNALMLGYINNDLPEEALDVYLSLTRSPEAHPDAHSFVAALTACGSLAALETGKAVHAHLLTSDCSPRLVLVNSLVDFYAKCGNILEAQLVFDSSPERDVVTLTALLTSYTRRGETLQAFRVFEIIKDEGLRPSVVTFLSLLAACSHSGMVDRGVRFFERMLPEYGVEPVVEHYHCLIDLLGRGNRLNEAVRAAETMPYEATGVTWLTVLAAARKWKNVEVAKAAFQKVVEIDKAQSSGYVLMANLYGSVGMPEEKLRVHALRRSSGAFKRPGKSWWSDKQGVLHRFVAGDWSHPQREEIHAKLTELQRGFDDDDDGEAFDHSERLAIACAIINSEPGSSVRIAKNLRVCEDCHKAISVISKVERRVIVCRDANRFHVFEQGKCSCGDFW